MGSWNRMAQQGQFWDEIKSILQTILEIVRSHYQEAKLSNQHQKNYSPQATGNNEEGNESIPDDVCQSKQELEEINLREMSVLDQMRVLGEPKGIKITKLTKKSLEDPLKIDQAHKELVDINQIYKMVSEDMKDDRMLRDPEILNEKKEVREGIT